MNQKKIELAKDADLAASKAAILRAAKRAQKIAASTNTRLVVFQHGECVRVKPGEKQKPE